MANFTQTNPSDNPQPGDKGFKGTTQDPRDRPFGAVGVDKAHGGGSDASEQATDARRGFGGDPSMVSGHNVNNPDSPTNPSSTAQRDLAFQDPRNVLLANQGPVTTVPTPTRNELDQLRAEGMDAQSKEGRDRLLAMREENEQKAADEIQRRADEAEERQQKAQAESEKRAADEEKKREEREAKADEARDKAKRENEEKAAKAKADTDKAQSESAAAAEAARKQQESSNNQKSAGQG
jgi:hypothetical protein